MKAKRDLSALGLGEVLASGEVAGVIIVRAESSEWVGEICPSVWRHAASEAVPLVTVSGGSQRRSRQRFPSVKQGLGF